MWLSNGGTTGRGERIVRVLNRLSGEQTAVNTLSTFTLCTQFFFFFLTACFFFRPIRLVTLFPHLVNDFRENRVS